MLPDFPNARRTIIEKLTEFYEQRTKLHSPGVLPNLSKTKIHEGDALIMQYTETFSHESELKQLTTSAMFDPKELINDNQKVFEILDGMAQDNAAMQTKMIFDTISDVTEKVGNVLRMQGKITPEDVFQMLEKIEIDFNRDGSPRLPVIHAGENMIADLTSVFNEIDESPMLKNRLGKIIERQRMKWYDRESNRKLVG